MTDAEGFFMSTHNASSPRRLLIRRDGQADLTALAELWQLFRHDASSRTGELPGPDGRFRTEWLDAATDSSDRAYYVARDDAKPVGFALIREVGQSPRVLNTLFVVKAVRKCGIGTQIVEHVLTDMPGAWTGAFQTENRAAVAFWRGLAAKHDDHWCEEQRPVPGRPDLAPDNWITIDCSR